MQSTRANRGPGVAPSCVHPDDDEWSTPNVEVDPRLRMSHRGAYPTGKSATTTWSPIRTATLGHGLAL